MLKAKTTEPDRDAAPASVRSIYPPILLLLVAGLLIYWSYGYGVTARRLPLLISTSTFVLIMLDILSRRRGKVGALIRSLLGAGFQDREMQHDPQWQSEIVQGTWLVTCVISMALFGILLTIPTFIFLYMVVQGKQKVIFSFLISTLAVVVIGMTFEIFLEYNLYRGMLLNQEGFE